MSDTLQVGNLTVRLEQDCDAESPREWDNLATMVCWHRRYNLGDHKKTKENFPTPQDFRESDDYKNAVVILPLYLYDHSGITMSCSAFSCPWDSGQVGYIYITREQVRKEFGKKRISKKMRERLVGFLQSEVKVYDMYLTGDVWGFIVEDSNGNNLDSCFGFFGTDDAFAQGKESAEHLIRESKKTDDMVANQFAL